jgi:hypothetical protein
LSVLKFSKNQFSHIFWYKLPQSTHGMELIADVLIQRLIAEFALKLKLRIFDSRMRREGNYVQ